MTYRVRIDPVAQRHIDDFAAYLRDYDEAFAIEQIERLDRIIGLNLGETPPGTTSLSPERPIGPTCSEWAGERITG